VSVITVWHIPLAPPSPPTEAELATLSDAEHDRAAQFLFDRDRARWLVAHVAMRRILGAEVGVAPAAIRYRVGPKGKPALAWPGGTGVEFNLSDSADLALLAVSRGAPVGVDVEFVKPVRELAAIARSHFAAEERAALFALPEQAQLDAFHRIWTRKEAFIKAVGTGLSYGLRRFAVTVGPASPRVVHLDGDAERARRWSLHGVEIAGPYLGALAVERTDVVVASRVWRG
jgi:4'-phosphopantetheinyl transferase